MLYNLYRPKTINEVVGHDNTVKALKKRFKDNDIPHRILLTGITGIGKTTLMRIISKNILCNNRDKENYSCNTCDICKAIDNEQQNGFYHELNASNLGINEVRDLVQDAEIKSFSQAKAKIFCIDEIQTMSKTPAALANLLKPLEKDYKNVYFILGSMGDVKEIPKAILNRCTTYNLKPISMEDIAKQLYGICKAEGIEIDSEEKANVIITVADNSYGSLRTAVSYLDRVIDSELWTVTEVVKELEIISVNDMVKSINNIFKGDPKAFEITYTKELVDKLRNTISTMYKIKSGVEVPSWQTKQLNGIDKTIQLSQIEFALDQLFELNKFSYLTQELIDFILVKILSNNKIYNSNLTPRRRGEI